MALRQGVKKLTGVVQNYSWGGFEFLPKMLGLENSQQKPFAEYWLGAHPNHSSLLENEELSLTDLIKKDPSSILGSSLAEQFDSLPYLLKVLDVRQMLSIQVHPGKSSAEKGYKRENELGIPLTASHRNYKDNNHKPELMVALSDFWLLHGFKKKEDLVNKLTAVPEFSFLLEIFRDKGYKELYEAVMNMTQERVNEVLDPLIKRILPLYHSGQLQKNQEDFWAVRAVITFCKEGHYDRGIFSIYLFNLLHLKKGEGIFQPAGMPHAYLEGQNVEVMANSDNVLRAGLTDKHIDVAELMKHVHFEATIPRVLQPEGKSHQVYASPAEEFELHRYLLKEQETTLINTGTAEILLVTGGSIRIRNQDQALEGERGGAFLLYPGNQVQVEALLPTELFRVTVPQKGKNE